jgi:hypothetical protein
MRHDRLDRLASVAHRRRLADHHAMGHRRDMGVIDHHVRIDAVRAESRGVHGARKLLVDGEDQDATCPGVHERRDRSS